MVALGVKRGRGRLRVEAANSLSYFQTEKKQPFGHGDRSGPSEYYPRLAESLVAPPRDPAAVNDTTTEIKTQLRSCRRRATNTASRMSQKRTPIDKACQPSPTSTRCAYQLQHITWRKVNPASLHPCSEQPGGLPPGPHSPTVSSLVT